MATKKVSRTPQPKPKTPAKTSSKKQDTTADNNYLPVLKPFQEILSAYLQKIDELYKQSLIDYDNILNENVKKLQETGNELNKDKERINEELKNSVVEAWRKSASNITYTQLQDQTLKDLSETEETKNIDAVNLQVEAVEKINELNKKYQDLYKKQYVEYTRNYINNLSGLKPENIEPNTFYDLGYITMSIAWYGYMTTN